MWTLTPKRNGNAQADKETRELTYYYYEPRSYSEVSEWGSGDRHNSRHWHGTINKAIREENVGGSYRLEAAINNTHTVLLKNTLRGQAIVCYWAQMVYIGGGGVIYTCCKIINNEINDNEVVSLELRMCLFSLGNYCINNDVVNVLSKCGAEGTLWCRYLRWT